MGFARHFGDLRAFLPEGGRRDEGLSEVPADTAGPLGVERMFCVDEGGDTTFFLCAGDGVQGKCGFAAGFRAEEFDDATTRKTATAECQIKGEGAGGNAREATDVFGGVQLHDGAFAEHFFDLADGVFEQHLVFVLGLGRCFFGRLGNHEKGS